MELSDILSSELPVPSELFTESAFKPIATRRLPGLPPLPAAAIVAMLGEIAAVAIVAPTFRPLLLLLLLLFEETLDDDDEIEHDDEVGRGDTVEAGRRCRNTFGLKLG